MKLRHTNGDVDSATPVTPGPRPRRENPQLEVDTEIDSNGEPYKTPIALQKKQKLEKEGNRQRVPDNADVTFNATRPQVGVDLDNRDEF
jgi:hypothetical protein